MTTADRVIPHNLDAEMCALASMMLNREAREDILGLVSREDYFLAEHQPIHDALAHLHRGNVPVDAVLLREELIRRRVLDEIGGMAYLARVLGSVPAHENGAHYARIVREKSARRRIVTVANEAINAAMDPSAPDAADIALAKAQELADIGANAANARNAFARFETLIPATYDALGAGGVPRILSGIAGIDAETGGFGLGEVVMIAARPSMGKSLVARNIALNMARAGVRVGIIAREESRHKIAKNAFAAVGRIKNRLMRTPSELTHADWSNLAAAANDLTMLPILIDDRTSHIDEIVARIRGWVVNEKVQCVIVDHIGRVNANGASDYARISEVSRRLADIFHDLGIVGINCAQLNREVTKRDDKRPKLADLRDSGRLEEDADAVLFLHREDYYHAEEKDYVFDDVMEIICAKWRDSARGWTVKVKAELGYQSIADLPPTEHF